MSTSNFDLSRFVVDFSQVPGTECLCGVAQRAFLNVPESPVSVHTTSISRDARAHYHRKLTEIYYFLSCEPDAQMELNGSSIPVRPGMCILVPPETRHRAIGTMQVLIIASPRFDPADEWVDAG